MKERVIGLLLAVVYAGIAIDTTYTTASSSPITRSFIAFPLPCMLICNIASI